LAAAAVEAEEAAGVVVVAGVGVEQLGEEVHAVEGAPVRVAPNPLVAADFVAELPVALEAAEGLVAVREAESVAAIDRQLCHRVEMSLATDRAALAALVESGIGRGASVALVALAGPEASADREVLEIGQGVLVDRLALQIDPVASVDRVASEIGRVASVG
jgi:hypothetical protein